MDLNEGQYELMIYTHNCLTNMESGYLNNLAVKFVFDINLVHWIDEEYATKS